MNETDLVSPLQYRQEGETYRRFVARRLLAAAITLFIVSVAAFYLAILIRSQIKVIMVV